MIAKNYSKILLLFFCLSFIACNRKKSEFLPIPKDAEIILKINTSSLASKLIFEKFEEFDLDALFHSNKNTSTLKTLIKNSGKAGLDYLEPVYIFQRKGIRYAIVKLDNEKKFNDFISKTLPKVISNSTHKSAQTDNLFIVWNKQIAIFQFDTDIPEYISKLINFKKSETAFANTVFLTSIKEKSDAVLLTRLDKLIPSSSTNLQYFSKDFNCTKIDFEEGKIELETNNLFHPTLKKQLKNLNSEGLSKTYKTIQSGFIGLACNSTLILNLLRTDALHFLSNYKINQNDFIKEFKGELYLRLDSINRKTETYTTYKFDDDFNKIETKEKKDVITPSFLLYSPLERDSLLISLLSKFHKDKIMDFRYANNYYFDLYNFPIYLKTDKSSLVISSRSMEEFPAVQPCEQCTNLSSLFLYIEINPPKLNFNNLSNIVDQISIKGDTKNLGIKTEILFHKKDPNGLLSLIEVFKAIQDSTQVIF